MSQTIETGQGGIEDVQVTFSAPTGTTTDQVQVAVGSYTTALAVGDADTWLTPQAVTVNSTTVTASLRIGNGHTNPTAGSYWLWYRIAATDGEVLLHPVRSHRFTVTDTSGSSVAANGPYVTQDELDAALAAFTPTTSGVDGGNAAGTFTGTPIDGGVAA
jgi:hypothetical protein